jgi:hypothetical protein
VEHQAVQIGEPLTYDFSTDYAWNASRSRFDRTYLPYRNFSRPHEIEFYLDGLDRRFEAYVSRERMTGRQPAFALTVPSFVSQYHQADVVLQRLASYAARPELYNVKLNQVSVADIADNDPLPVLFPSGTDKPGHVPGSRYVVSAMLDFGETLPPLLRSSTQPLAKVRLYDFKLAVSGESANIGISCQIINSNAPRRFDSESGYERDSKGALFPVLDPRDFSYERFTDASANLRALLDEGLGPMPKLVYEFLRVRSSADLRTINLDLMLSFPNMQIDDHRFILFLNAVAHFDDWIHRAL